MNDQLKPFVAPRASANDTLANAHLLEKKLGVLGIGTTGITGIPVTASNAGMAEATEADLVALGADPAVDKLNLYVTDTRGTEHNVAGLNKWLTQHDIVNGIERVMAEVYGGSQATAQYLRALSTIPAVVAELRAALGG